ncbi:hypothetical protein MKEN_00280000 [Mycena kentingensis (nom. inval.)]|nr:hypothetical protein MKEN_00280000 [Mycena kentingensis (nom. inval.)]
MPTGILSLDTQGVCFYALWVIFILVVWKNRIRSAAERAIPTFIPNPTGTYAYPWPLSLLEDLSTTLELCASVFRIPCLHVPRGALHIVSGKKHVREVVWKPEEMLSFRGATAQRMQLKYTVGPEFLTNPYHVAIIRGPLTRSIERLVPRLTDEMQFQFTRVLDDLLPADGAWRKVKVLDAILQIVSPSVNRVVVGLPVCREPEYISACIEFAGSVLPRGRLISLFPDMLKPIVGPLLSKRNTCLRRIHKFLGPVIDERIKQDDAFGREREGRPDDFLTWLLDVAEGEDRTSLALCRRILLINFVSTHTTSVTLTTALLDLLKRPEYLAPLRAEAEQVWEDCGHVWSKEAIGKLVMLDAFIRESQRFGAGIGPTAVSRKVMEKEGFRFSDGTLIPHGAILAVPATAIHHDPEIYAHPESFDPARSTPINQLSDNAEKLVVNTPIQTLVSTSPEHLSFGHGRHSCPGRFFAATEIKAMLAHILLNYELAKVEDGSAELQLGAEVIIRKKMSLLPSTLMSFIVVDLPPDILLVLCSHLDIQDLVNFLLTCRPLRRLSEERTLWTSAVHRVEDIQHHPIAAFLGNDLTAVPTHKLKDRVRRAARILRNLAAPRPILHHVGGCVVGDLRPQFVIPGTKLLVLAKRGVVACWDVIARRCVSQIEIDQLTLMTFSGAPRVEIGSTALLAGTITAQFIPTQAQNGLVDREIKHLVAIFIDTANAARISTVLSPPVNRTARRWHCESFVTPELMGFGTETELVFWSMQANEPVRYRPYPFLAVNTQNITGNQSAGLIYDASQRTLYGLSPGYHSRGDAAIYRVPFTPSSDDHIPSASAVFDEIPIPVRFPRFQSQTALMAGSNFNGSGSTAPVFLTPATFRRFGVFAVTMRTFHSSGISVLVPESEEYLHFSTSDSAGGADPARIEDSHTVYFQAPPGTSMYNAIGHSGRYAFIMCSPRHRDREQQRESQAAHPIVGLVCLRTPPPDVHESEPYTQFSRFDVQSELDFLGRKPHSPMLLDDVLGLVVVTAPLNPNTGQEGRVDVYSYSGHWS